MREWGRVVPFLFLLMFSGCNNKIDESTGALKRLGVDLHNKTVWNIRPSYPHDALTFMDLLTCEPLALDQFSNNPADPFIAEMNSDEKKAVNQIRFVIRDCLGASVAGSLTYLYEITKSEDLYEFRRKLSNPRQLMEDSRKVLDIYSVFFNNSRRIPLWLFSHFCRNLQIYLDFLQRMDFESYWQENWNPMLSEISLNLQRDLAPFNMVPIVEQILGGGLPNMEITVYLSAFVRPRAFCLTESKFLCEDRVDYQTILKTAAHELVHGYVDWSSEEYKSLAEIISRDPFIEEKLYSSKRKYRDVSWVEVAEESLTEAVDQIVLEALSPLEAVDPKERWWFQDDFENRAALALYRYLRESRFEAGGSFGFNRDNSDWTLVFPEGFVEKNWEEEFGFSRPEALPDSPGIRRIYDFGDSQLDTLGVFYNETLKVGQFAVFLDDWFPFDGEPADTLKILDKVGRKWNGTKLVDPVSGNERIGRYIGSGNMSSTKDGYTVYYRNVLYFEAD